MKKNEDQESRMQYLPIYMCIGVSVGAALGAAKDNVGLYMSIGLSIGVFIGSLVDYLNRKNSEAGTEDKKEKDGGEEE